MHRNPLSILGNSVACFGWNPVAFSVWACATLLLWTSQPAAGQDDPPTSLAGNEQVVEIMKSFAPRGVQSDGSQPTPPLEALKKFQMHDGFEFDLVASEPQISQPLF